MYMPLNHYIPVLHGTVVKDFHLKFCFLGTGTVEQAVIDNENIFVALICK